MTKLYATIISLLCATFCYGQCLDLEAHNTSIIDTWISCEAFPNPLGSLGNNHWILYEFEEVQDIENIRVWNINHPEYNNFGIKTLRIDFSADGANWTELVTADLPIGEVSPDYLGELLEAETFEAQYVLFTSLENHGGACTGLAEVKFNLSQLSTATEDTFLSSLIDVSPNPADDLINISFGDIKTEDISYQLVDMNGRIVLRKEVPMRDIKDGLSLTSTSLADGHYTLHMRTDEGVAAKQIIVVHPK